MNSSRNNFGYLVMLVTGVIAVTVLGGCAVVRTRQFILDPSQAKKGPQVGGWKIESPRVVAFREVSKLSTIPDTSMFYFSFEARRDKKTDTHTDLLIDSARFDYCFLSFQREVTNDTTANVELTGEEDCSYILPSGDSAGHMFQYGRVDTTQVSVWRHVTRAQEYSLNEWNHFQKEFDFFGDQGIQIPICVTKLYVTFDAVVFDSANGLSTRYPITLNLQREEEATTVPFHAR